MRQLHASEQAILRFFTYDHLGGDMREVSEKCAMLATQIVTRCESSAELTAGLRKLLEAKDCFVRAVLEPKK